MNRLAVINVVGLTESLIGPQTPRLVEFLQRGAMTRIVPAFPAVTCTAQSNYLTGKTPREHGIVGNGWYHRELAEVQFWKQSNHLVQAAKVWEELRARHPAFTCAKLFWWHNMYSSADYSITPRPMYPADGRKVFDIHAWPYSIRADIKRDLGEFPFFGFWGPAAGVDTPQGAADATSRWIAESAKWMEIKYQPGLSLVYLPHLDYNLQRHGPHARDAPGGATRTPRSANPLIHRDLEQIDVIVGDLIAYYQGRGVRVLVLSEYGITNVDTPIHLNRIFREQGWVSIKEELGLELLDCGASKAFAVADHQVAHIYLNDRSLEHPVRELVARQRGVQHVLGPNEKTELHVDHPRAGDFVAVAEENAWFTYYYWHDNSRAPDFARTVDIHRKPGFDPVELFLDPKLPAVELRIAWRLLRKRLGFRMLMDVIPLDATLVKGSHGCRPANAGDWPVLIAGERSALAGPELDSTHIFQVIRSLIG